MKKIALSLTALLALVALPMLASAQDSKTLTGEPVDITCYLTGKSGAGHASCAAACAKKGQPVGLLVEEGGKKQVYLVLGKTGEEMAGHMGKQVKATGKVASKEGLMCITITEIGSAG